MDTLYDSRHFSFRSILLGSTNEQASISSIRAWMGLSACPDGACHEENVYEVAAGVSLAP